MQKKEYLVSLDLFSGIAGITKALEGFCLPAAYCDVSVASRETLTRLMEKQFIPHAPICPDIAMLDKRWLKQHSKHKHIDILIAGFPCIGFSSVGSRKGFANPQSSLFSHILRLIDETQCPQIFLENVPNILHLGMAYIVSELADKRGFELRWTIVSARDVGAPHKRDRWFCFGIRKAVHVVPHLLPPHADYKPYPWSDADARKKEPPRLQMHMTPRQVQQLALLGNSVVPDAVRYAFFTLVMPQKVLSLDTPQELPLHLSVHVRPGQKSKPGAFGSAPKYPRNGILYRDGTLVKTPHPQPFRTVRPLRLVFDPSVYTSPKEPSHMLTSEYIDRPVTAHTWSTPRFGNTMACNFLTSRSIRDLPTQIRFEVASTKKTASVKAWKLRHRGKMSPAFVEYLMGYPIGWTDV